MTLRDKLKPTTSISTEGEARRFADKLVIVAEDFAIGFAEWIRKETYYEHLTKEFIYKRNVYKCEKELLQIYKQEQQL